jgi:hypothetical protein
MKILFILKERYYENNLNVKSYGLINSSTQLSLYLQELHCKTKVVTVIDANGIDKEIYEFKPDIVILEALWVPSEKLKELIEIKRYKKIIWIVRIHSDIGFLGVETLALTYINDYIKLNKQNLIIAPNNEEFTKYLSNSIQYHFTYLPNIIEEHFIKKREVKESNIIKIGCFGALRILKNQLFQAMCAMKAADILNKTLQFHIMVNVKPDDKVKNPILKNFDELFKTSKHKLIKHKWMENNEFQHLIRKMDLGLQLSYTESFNIVTADFINNDTLILVSDVISWMPETLKTSTNNYDEVVNKIIKLYKRRNSWFLKRKMRNHLITYNINAKIVWFEFMQKLTDHDHHDHHDSHH